MFTSSTGTTCLIGTLALVGVWLEKDTPSRWELCDLSTGTTTPVGKNSI